MKRLIAGLVAGAVLGSTGLAVASTQAGWKVLAKAENTSASYSYASANVDVNRPKGLRLQAFGSQLKVSGYFSCQLADRRVQSGQAVVLNIPAAKSCSVYGSATAEDGGKLRLLVEGR